MTISNISIDTDVLSAGFSRLLAASRLYFSLQKYMAPYPRHRKLLMLQFLVIIAGAMPLSNAAALVTFHPPASASTAATQSPADSRIAESLERIARAHEVAVAQREADKTDNRPTRDLAAQEAMAHWAKLSFLVALVSATVSGLGLIALLFSLRLNRTATAAAQSAVAVARETNESQSRAWVSANCVLENPAIGMTQAGVKGIYFNVACQAKNHGRSPATGVSFHAEIALVGKNMVSPEEQMNKYCDSIRERSDRDADAIFPEATATFGHMVFLPLRDIEEDMAGKDFKMIAPVVYGCLNYKSIYTQGVRQTRFVFHVATADQTGQAMVLQPDQPNWLERPIGLAQPGTVTTD